MTEIITRLNQSAIWKYAGLLNGTVKQYVEDRASYDLLRKAGFEVEIMPLPMAVGDLKPLPVRHKVAVDIDQSYNFIFELLQKSLPDIDLEAISGVAKLEDISGLAHFHPDRTVSIGMKRAILAGRAVVSNVQAPFMGFVDDNQNLDVFIPKAVDKIRELVYAGPNPKARDYYSALVSPTKLMEATHA